MRSLVLISGLLAMASASYAFPIAFTLQGIGTITIGSSTFTSFTVSTLTDTSNVDYIPVTSTFAEFSYQLFGPQVDIPGAGSGIMTNANYLLLNQFTDNPSNSSIVLYGSPFPSAGNIGMNDSSFALYNLQSAFGPLTSTIAAASFAGYTFSSTLGQVTIDSLSSMTFTATTVPEPASAPLLAATLALVIFAARRQRAW